MPTNLLLLPFLGGYWFLHVFYYTRFRSQRLDGYRLIVESALMGVVLTFVSRLIDILLGHYSPFRSAWLSIAPPQIPLLGTATGSLILGLVAGQPLNLLLGATGFLTLGEARGQAIERHGNELLRLLHKASAEERTVSVSMDNGKVYVGLVVAAPNLAPHDTYLGITPFYSGYRSRDTLELVFTVDYLGVYEEQTLDPRDFRVVLPMISVRMASFFDQSAYPAFIVESGEPEAS
jgi:hypothetical protein